jgi:hypothetical protein
MKVIEQKSQKQLISDFIELVLKHCPDLQQIKHDVEDEGDPIPHRLFLFGKKIEKIGFFKSLFTRVSSPERVLEIHRSLKNIDIPLKIVGMPQFRGKYRQEIEMFKGGKWDNDLVIHVSESLYADCAKKLAKEYEKISGSDEVKVVFEF